MASTRPAKPFGEPQAPGELVPQQGNLPKGNVAISPSAEAANLKRQMDDKKKAEDAARKQAEQRARQNAMDYEAQAYTVGAPAAAQSSPSARRQNAMDYEAQAYNVGAPAAAQANPSARPQTTVREDKPKAPVSTGNMVADVAIGLSDYSKRMLPEAMDTGLKTLGREVTLGALNVQDGIKNLLGDANHAKSSKIRDVLASGISEARANTVGGRVGTHLGGALRFAGGLSNFGMGDILGGVGEDVATAYDQGVTGVDLDKVRKSSFAKHALAAVVGKAAGMTARAGSYGVVSTKGLTDSAVGKVVNISDVVASEAMSEGLTMFADRDKDKQLSSPEVK